MPVSPTFRYYSRPIFFLFALGLFLNLLRLGPPAFTYLGAVSASPPALSPVSSIEPDSYLGGKGSHITGNFNGHGKPDFATENSSGLNTVVILSVPVTTAAYLALTGPPGAIATIPVVLTTTALTTEYNNAVGYTGTVHYTSSDGGATLPPDYTFTPADQGEHSLSFTFSTLGAVVVTATDTVNSSLVNSITLQITGMAAHIVVFAGSPQSTTVKTDFPIRFQARATDGDGNPVFNVPVSFTVPAGVGSFSGSPPFTWNTDSNGVATAAIFRASCSPASFTVTATTVGAPSPAVFNLTSTPGSPATITATSGSGQSTPFNTNYANPLVATVKDACNNLLSGVEVGFSTPSGVGVPSGLFGSSHLVSATTNLSGVATAPTLTANNVTGVFTATANVNPPLGSPAQYNLTVCNPAIVLLTSDNGSCGTLRFAVGYVAAGTTITFTVSSAIMLTDTLTISRSVTVKGATLSGSTCSGSGVTLDGTGVGSAKPGLVVSGGATLIGLNLVNFGGVGLKVGPGGGNHFYCFKVVKPTG